MLGQIRSGMVSNVLFLLTNQKTNPYAYLGLKFLNLKKNVMQNSGPFARNMGTL